MPAKTGNLMAAIDRLEQAVNACGNRGPEDAAPLDRALGDVEQTIRDHAKAFASPDGGLVDVNGPRVPSPGVTRRTDQLRDELQGLLDEVQALRKKAGAAPPSGVPFRPENLAGALPVAPEVGGLADFAVFCRRARALLQRLEHYEDEEADLILDTVNTDIGAGD